MKRQPGTTELASMNLSANMTSGIGQPVRRKEDFRLLTGRGSFAGFTAVTSLRRAAMRAPGKGIAVERRQNLRSRRHRQRHGRAGGELSCARGGMVGCPYGSSAVRRKLPLAWLRSEENADQR